MHRYSPLVLSVAALMTSGSANAQSDGFVYLNCAWRDAEQGKSGADLYKIGNGQFNAYDDDRTRVRADLCLHISNGTSGCSLTDTTFFASVTEGSGSDLYQDQTDINRISGAYMHRTIFGGVMIEHVGQCQRTAAPPVPEKKF